jgi:hypothetical protein
MSFVGSNILAGASGQGGGGFAIERSLRFNSGDSAYLSRNFAAGNRKKWTWSGWFKLSKLGQRNYIFTNWNSSGQLSLYLEWTNSDKIRIGEYSSSAWEWQLDSTSQFRDSSAWYHLVVAVDTTQSTASDRVKVYINGEQLTSFSPSNYPSQNKDTYVNQAVEHNIGRLQTTEADFYLADVHFIDGQALAATDFGETDEFGVWQPKEFEGNYAGAYSGTTTSLSQTGWNPSQSGNIWDGNASSSSRATGYAGGTKGTVSFYPPLTNVIKVEVWTQNYVNYLNGASVSTPESINGGWHTFYDNSGSPITLNSVGNAYDTNNTQTVDIAGIRINGSIVDSQTWTPPSGVGFASTGANSFHLDFADNSSNAALGTDTSGNSNTWTVNNLTAASTKVATFNGTTNVSGSMTALGNQDWTVELFFEKTGSGTQEAFFGFPGNWPYFEYDGGQLRWMTSSTYGPTLAQNQRYHAAWVRYNNKGYIYLDGTLISPSSGITYTTNETDTAFAIGARQGGGTGLNGYMDNLRVVVGTALYTSNFTVPSTPLAAVTNCQLLALQTDLTTDSSGQNVSLTNNGAIFSDPNGPSVDSLVDTPTNGTQTDTGAGGEVVGNYATLNPLYTGATLSDGNLKATKGSLATWEVAVSTIGMKHGKWYAEITIGTGNHQIGIVNLDDAVFASNTPLVDFPWGWGFINDSSTLRLRSYLIGGGSSTTDVAFGASGSNYVDGDILGLAYDADTQAFSIYKNGTLVGNTTSSWVVPPPAGTYAFAISLNTGNVSWNFGQRAFANSIVPSGYKALCTSNLPEPTIADGSKYFDTLLWTGDGSTTRAISGLEFSPDLCWTKARSIGFGHRLWDTVRGATKRLESHATTAEATEANGVKSFDSNGFTIGNDGNVNQNNYTFASWNWDAGDSNTTIAAGGLNSSVYNQSQVWSNNNNAVSNPANATDGNLSSYAQTSDPTSQIVLSSIGGLSGLVRVYVGTSGGTRYLISTNDGTTVTTATFWGGGWVTVGTASNITTITTTRIYSGNTNPTNDCRVYGYEIAGKLLIDSGVSVTNVPSIASTVRANPSAGFSIVSYTGGGGSGATVGHSLNAKPEFIIVKSRTSGENWFVNYPLGTGDGYLMLNQTNAGDGSNVTVWNSTAATSSVITLGSTNGVNGSQNYIAYCFAPVEGYSAMGSYTGNGSTDGVFVHTGFKIAWLMVKRTDATNDWVITDGVRNTSNVVDKGLYADLSSNESTSTRFDFVSNGFKIRNTLGEINASGGTYIYLAFAEHPFKTARAR